MFRKRINESLGSLGTVRKTRRGAKLGIVIAILLALPGLVAGTAYVTGASSGSITTASANSVATCGWVAEQGANDNTYLTGITGLSATPSATLSVTLQAITTGGATGSGSGYEYLVDEAAFECTSLPAGTNTVSFVVCGNSQTLSAGACSGTASTISNADWVALELSTVAPAYATNPVKSSPSQECETTPAPLYSSVATTTTASTWSPVPDYIYNDAQTTPGFLGTGTTTTGGCIAGAALPATMPVTVSTPVVYVSFIVVDESASGLSGVGTDIFTLGFSMNLA